MLYKENKENQENKKTPQIVEVFNSGLLNIKLNSKLNSILYRNKAFIPQSNKTVKAFTLIELLVVIAIIGILSTLVIVALGNSRAKARDSKRLNDLKAMSNALELYYADNNEYPSSITPGQPLELGGVVYMSKVPNNPTPWTDGGCPNTDYTYTQVDSGQSYNISACLGTQAPNSPSTTSTTVSYSPSGIFQCGQNMEDSRDNKTYQTVQIGTQCWMKENLNTGTMVTSQTTSPCVLISTGVYSCQLNDSIIEKYCYANNAANCTTHGGLYEWQEAMQLPASCVNSDCSAQIQTPHRGICPVGWHIPTDQEFNTLEQYTVATIASIANQYTCNTSASGWQRCADNNGNSFGGASGAGKSLKKVGQGSGVGAGDDLVGFSAMLSGQRAPGSTFDSLSGYSDFWIATQNSSSNGWLRYFYTTYSTIFRGGFNKTYGYSVRCLKDS